MLIFERIREELRTARGTSRAINLGFEKAMSSIIDANITTLIVAVICYFMGSGPVRGFAVTLALGIICTVFTAVNVTAAADHASGTTGAVRRRSRSEGSSSMRF